MFVVDVDGDLGFSCLDTKQRLHLVISLRRGKEGLSRGLSRSYRQISLPSDENSVENRRWAVSLRSLLHGGPHEGGIACSPRQPHERQKRPPATVCAASGLRGTWSASVHGWRGA